MSSKDRLLSRAAERMYWLGRYVERTENTARLLGVYGSLLFDLPVGTQFGWHTLIDLLGAEDTFGARYSKRDERNVVKFLIADTSNASSIVANVALARENARTSRELIPSRGWEALNNMHHFVRENAAASLARRARGEFLGEVVARCQQLAGLLDGTMSHDAAYHFIRLGQALERGDMTTRIVDIGASTHIAAVDDRAPMLVEEGLGYESSIWLAVLNSSSGMQMYRRHYSERVEPSDVVSFLLTDRDFPRAFRFCLGAAERCLDCLPPNRSVKTVIRRTGRELDAADLEPLLNGGLHEFVDTLQLGLASAHEKINETWFYRDR